MTELSQKLADWFDEMLFVKLVEENEMIGNNELTLNQATMQDVLEFWLNNQLRISNAVGVHNVAEKNGHFVVKFTSREEELPPRGEAVA